MHPLALKLVPKRGESSIHELVPSKRHHPVTCKARVRQVKLKTYPSMVLVPSLYKIGHGLAATESN